MTSPASLSEWRETARRLVLRPWFQRTILVLILVNAAILGLETSNDVMASIGPLLIAIDTVILAVFVIEIALRLFASGPRFFRDPWSVFDFAVVAVALVPDTGPLSVLRSLRVLRALRSISAVPRLRRVVASLLGAIPGLGAIVALLGLIFYVAGVMATMLFGRTFPDWFGSLPASAYTLFQVMTLESWSMGIVRPVMEVHPYAWLFFIPFIAIATFTMLNLFIAVVVNAMQSEHDALVDEAEAHAKIEREEMLAEIRRLRRDVADLRAALPPNGRPGGQPGGQDAPKARNTPGPEALER